jgi:hypothetical protein
MPNDAKLGLVIGVSLVIAVALMLFRKDAPAAVSIRNRAKARRNFWRRSSS